MTAEFRIGDVVRLKSGGPDMTITAMEAEEGADETRIFAVWHDGEVLTRAELPEIALEHGDGNLHENSEWRVAQMKRAPRAPYV